MADTKFIEENKEALLEEMSGTISDLNTIIGSVLQTPIPSPQIDGTLMRTYFAATAMQIGSLTALFNQYYVLLKGVVPKENRPAGFAGLIKSAETKVAKPSVQEEEDKDD
jgi:hypothetical protein